MNISSTCLVCTDCALFIANGDLPEGDEDCKRVLAGAESALPGTWSIDSQEDSVTTFSRRPCAYCGTTLAGERMWASVVSED